MCVRNAKQYDTYLVVRYAVAMRISICFIYFSYIAVSLAPALKGRRLC